MRAQRAVEALAAQAAARGARVVRSRATPEADTVRLDDGTVLEADRIVWSCGGWLAGLFGELVQLKVTRQELFFFDGGPAWADAPGWVDYDRAAYGTGDVDALGVKVATDAEGPPLDPDADAPAGLGGRRTRRPRLRRRPLPGARATRR